MSRFTRCLAGLLALVLAATPLPAQTRATTATMTVTLLATLTCTNIKNIDFGSVLPTVGTISTGPTNYAQVDCTTESGNKVNVSFTIPGTMVKTGDATKTISLQWGTISAGVADGAGGPQTFDPAVGLTNFLVNSGTLHVMLGQSGVTGCVSATVCGTVTGKPAGVYTASLTITVAIAA